MQVSTKDISGANSIPLWEYSDPNGDLIIVLETEQYRVCRESVESHSVRLKSVLESFEPFKCAVIRLYNTSSDDWDAVMSLIMDAPTKLSATVLPIPTLLSIFRLHKEYNMPILKGYADDDIKKIFPYEFDNWRTYHYLAYQPDVPREHTSRHEFKSILAFVGRNPLVANGSKYLPAALYLCISQRTVVEISQGRDEPDGPMISADIKKRLEKGARALALECSRHRYKWWMSRNGKDYESCKQPEKCRKEVETTMDRILEATDSDRIQDALHMSSTVLNRYFYLCAECQRDASQAALDVARSIFNKLPAFFDLPPWENLLGTKNI